MGRRTRNAKASSDAAEEEEKTELIRKIRLAYARLQQLKLISQQQDKEDLAAEKLQRAAVEARTVWEQGRRRHENTQLLQEADALHGRGVIDQLEERWTAMSQQPNIAQLGRWERWAVLKEERAEQLRAVALHGEPLITPAVWNNLLPVLQHLHERCVRNAGWFNDRVWIEADDLQPHGGRLLTALCKCLDVCFTCFDRGRVFTSYQRLTTGYDIFDKVDATPHGSLFNV